MVNRDYREQEVTEMESRTVFALLLLCGSAIAADVAQSCSSSTQTYESIQVLVGDKECTTSPCQLVRGQVAKCLIRFQAVNEITEIVQKINATVLGTGITTGFPVPNADQGCDKITDSFCPLNAGETVTVELAFEVLKIYPKVGLQLAIYLLDQDQNQIACFIMQGNVVDA